MSHVALRRLMIRLLHDPALVERIHRDPAAALARVELTPQERGWILAVPPEAWATDPERPGRLLAGLLEEYPVASRLAPERAATFFGSIHFHAAVQERGSLAAALGAHLAEAPDPLAAAVARIEAAVARARRAARTHPPGPPETLRLAAGAELVALPQGAVAAFAALRAATPPAALQEGEEHALVLRVATGGDVTVEQVPAALAAILTAAADGAARPALAALARSLGADAGEEHEILDRLVRDRLLV